MVKIQSEEKIINQPITVIFDYLSNFNNWQNLMPEQVNSWQSNRDTCQFYLKALSKIGMKIIERNENSFIKAISYKENPAEFELITQLETTKENNTKINICFLLDINSMKKILVERPLKNFLNYILEELLALNI